MKTRSKLSRYQTITGENNCPCGKRAETVDHIIPVTILKQFLCEEAILEDDDNFQFLCRVCNQIKGSTLDWKNPKTGKLLRKYLVEAIKKTDHLI